MPSLRVVLRIVICCHVVGVSPAVPAMAQATPDLVAHPLDESVATTVLPYSHMACWNVDCRSSELAARGYVRDISWQDALRRGGASESIIAIYERAGFSAEIYRNDQLREIVVAYRGTEGSLGSLVRGWAQYQIARFKERLGVGSRDVLEGDWATNFRARDVTSPLDRLEAQYVAARSLASRLGTIYGDRSFRDYTVSLTGHSLGGALASYAGQHSRNTRVFTFDSARNLLAGTAGNPQQINIIASGDAISDSRSQLGRLRIFGSTTSLPGRTYAVAGLPGFLRERHDLNALISGIEATAGVVNPPSNAKTIFVQTGDRARPMLGWQLGTMAPASREPTGGPPSAVRALGQGTDATRALQALARDYSKLLPAQPGRPAPAAYVPPTSTFLQPPQPAGISLSLAAAMRMALNLRLEGVHYDNGRIVLMGEPEKGVSLDAALFLTALRAACLRQDPYFSLDADDGKAWSEEGHHAAQALWERIRGDFTWDTKLAANAGRNRRFPLGFSTQAVSARRHYPLVWAGLAPRYPNLKTRLVFRPEWLRRTRLGEILYLADLLIKELLAGLPVLPSSANLLAGNIERYVSADARSAAQALLGGFEGRPTQEGSPRWSGHRLWFDFLPAERIPKVGIQPLDIVKVRPVDVSKFGPHWKQLNSILGSRGYFDHPEAPNRPTVVRADDDTLDLSVVYPRMFVRRHDLSSGVDLEGSSPTLDQLSNDVNARFERYMVAYKELRDLTAVFRAYVAAVMITQQDDAVCRKIQALPIMKAEEAANPLPEHHPSELFVTVARYVYARGNQRTMSLGKATSVNGGVALRGSSFYSGRFGLPTSVTKELKREALDAASKATWSTSSGRRFIAFTLPSGAGADGIADVRPLGLATPEEVLQKQDEARRVAEAHRRKQEEAREAAIKKKQEDDRKAAARERRQLLEGLFGPVANRATLGLLVPYAEMVGDLASGQSGSMERGIERVAKWEELLREGGYSDARIRTIASTGFVGALYRRASINELVLVIGTKQVGDTSPLGMGTAQIDTQLKVAADLAWVIRYRFSNAGITLIGNGPGGVLAEFAAEHAGLSRVIAFKVGIPFTDRTREKCQVLLVFR